MKLKNLLKALFPNAKDLELARSKLAKTKSDNFKLEDEIRRKRNET